MNFSVLSVALFAIVGCTTMQPNSVRESLSSDVSRCKLLGNVNGADAVFVGLSSSIGSRNAKAKAMNQAADLKATDVVWSQQGTSMTNEWIGRAYACK
ncbi:hypothetical protein [Noviherbaspirillum humi]|uniref:hypothetical protein n=1 Tax=Noviherbaspirillum humi TaxID=1688639 RepID=UPI0011609467|nr:hypothetical protein [Noviherbaspirillum humi]